MIIVFYVTFQNSLSNTIKYHLNFIALHVNVFFQGSEMILH